MILLMLTTDRLAREQSADEQVGVVQQVQNPDYSYLRNLPADSFAFVWHPFFSAVCSELYLIPEVGQCFDPRNDNTLDKISEAYHRQTQVVSRLTGMDSANLYVEQILLKDIRCMGSKDRDILLFSNQGIRSLLYHPFSQTCFDIAYGEQIAKPAGNSR